MTAKFDAHGSSATQERVGAITAEISVLTRRLTELDREVRTLVETQPPHLAACQQNDAPSGPMSRRGLLRGAAIAVVGGGAAMLANAAPAAAATGDPVLAGETNAAGTYTGLGVPDGSTGLFVTSGPVATQAGNFTAAIVGDSQNGAGVAGLSDNQAGVFGRSGAASGISWGSTGVAGDAHDGTGVLGLSYAGDGVHGVSSHGNGVNGFSTGRSGVLGYSTVADGVLGEAEAAGGVGVRGKSAKLTGVYGLATAASGLACTAGVVGDSTAEVGSAGMSANNTGVYGLSGAAAGPAFVAGVVGDSTDSYGVVGVSHTRAGLYGKGSRGAILTGTKAQARLVASKAVTHPAGGTLGDLFVDASGRLWFCKHTSSTAATWAQLA